MEVINLKLPDSLENSDDVKGYCGGGGGGGGFMTLLFYIVKLRESNEKYGIFIIPKSSSFAP